MTRVRQSRGPLYAQPCFSTMESKFSRNHSRLLPWTTHAATALAKSAKRSAFMAPATIKPWSCWDFQRSSHRAVGTSLPSLCRKKATCSRNGCRKTACISDIRSASGRITHADQFRYGESGLHDFGQIVTGQVTKATQQHITQLFQTSGLFRHLPNASQPVLDGRGGLDGHAGGQRHRRCDRGRPRRSVAFCHPQRLTGGNGSRAANNFLAVFRLRYLELTAHPLERHYHSAVQQAADPRGFFFQIPLRRTLGDDLEDLGGNIKFVRMFLKRGDDEAVRLLELDDDELAGLLKALEAIQSTQGIAKNSIHLTEFINK